MGTKRIKNSKKKIANVEVLCRPIWRGMPNMCSLNFQLISRFLPFIVNVFCSFHCIVCIFPM